MKTHLSLIACAVLALTACGKSEQSAGSAPADAGAAVVKIGSANPLTGPFAHWGRDADNGVKLAVAEANAEN